MDRLRAFWASAQLIVSAAIILAIVVSLVVKFGFAWALIACVVVFLIWARRFDPGPYGANAWFVPLVGIFAAVCLAVGLIVRLAVT
ncbi:hypothetical protein [Brevundimonas sp. UBA7664]|uniref:hypothetical protein n=1 Tax=Brevundimonas sp. UBA7664 TaxID=1946141 RepID=UPI0025C4A751|nr:hypothetical protein [Brevundimonas sp. UBA7664]